MSLRTLGQGAAALFAVDLSKPLTRTTASNIAGGVSVQKVPAQVRAAW